jgi:cobalt/nickel transport system permease protein
VIIMSAVLMAQSLIFQDGGLLALGANIFNMGIIGGFGAYNIYRLFNLLLSERGRYISGFIAAWGSVVLASAACAFELAISGTSPLGTVLPAMTGIHVLIGIGEGLITVAVLKVLATSRVDLLKLARI